MDFCKSAHQPEWRLSTLLNIAEHTFPIFCATALRLLLYLKKPMSASIFNIDVIWAFYNSFPAVCMEAEKILFILWWSNHHIVVFELDNKVVLMPRSAFKGHQLAQQWTKHTSPGSAGVQDGSLSCGLCLGSRLTGDVTKDFSQQFGSGFKGIQCVWERWAELSSIQWCIPSITFRAFSHTHVWKMQE